MCGLGERWLNQGIASHSKLMSLTWDTLTERKKNVPPQSGPVNHKDCLGNDLFNLYVPSASLTL